MRGVDFKSVQVVPYSSVVGGGLMLLDAKGAVVGQVMLMGIDQLPALVEYRDHYEATCERLAALLNGALAREGKN